VRVDRRKAVNERFARWYLKHIVIQLVFVTGFVVLGVLRSQTMRRYILNEHRLPLVTMVVIVAAGLLPSAWNVWRSRDRDPVELTRKMQQERDAMNGDHWLRRILLLGVTLGVGFGAMLCAFIPFAPVSELIGGSVARTAIFSIASSLILTIPSVFLLRWVFLGSYHRFFVTESS
jgi:sulfite exporter TauE/SafE